MKPQLSADNLPSWYIFALCAVIVYIIIRDVWALTKAIYRFLKPYAVWLGSLLREVAIEDTGKTLDAIASFCYCSSQVMLQVQLTLDDQPSFWACLDALFVSILNDLGSMIGQLAHITKLKRLLN